MRKYRLFTILVLIFMSTFCLKTFLFGDQERVNKEDVAEIVNMLRGYDWGDQVYAFNKVTTRSSMNEPLILKKEYDTPEIRDALFLMLKDSCASNRVYSDYEGTFDSELIEVIGNMGEKRAIPYLLEQVSSGGAAIYALAKIGEPAVAHVIEKLKSNSYIGIKTGCVIVLGEMVKEKKTGYVAKSTAREKIKRALIEAFKSAKHPIPNKPPSTKREAEKIKYNERMAANLRTALVRAYGNLGDEEVIPLIKKTVAEDPHFVDSSKDPHSRLKERYIVREEAQKVLEKLKKEGKIKE